MPGLPRGVGPTCRVSLSVAGFGWPVHSMARSCWQIPDIRVPQGASVRGCTDVAYLFPIAIE